MRETLRKLSGDDLNVVSGGGAVGISGIVHGTVLNSVNIATNPCAAAIVDVLASPPGFWDPDPAFFDSYQIPIW